MKERLYKYQGAGNDFIIIDNRDGHIKDGDLAEGGKLDVKELCNRHYGIGSDGLMLLEEPTSRSADCRFRMRFFNPDGSGGMMCGNGGRCIVAFAEHCGILPSDGDKYVFEAPDGLHEAYIVQTDGSQAAAEKIDTDKIEAYGIGADSISADRTGTSGTGDKNEDSKIGYCRIGGLQTRKHIRLKMKDVEECRRVKIEHLTSDGKPEIVEGVFMDTGTRHFVTFVENVDECDVVAGGRTLRYDKVFAPEGANINFVESGHFCKGTSTNSKMSADNITTADRSIMTTTGSKTAAGHSIMTATGSKTAADHSIITATGSKTAANHSIMTATCDKTDADCNAIKVRTYEKGVEDETEACGTGITASAIASCIYGIPPFHIDRNGVYHYKVRARRETLEVEFKPKFRKDAVDGKGVISPVASSVWLSGPAVKVAEIIYEQSDNFIDNNL